MAVKQKVEVARTPTTQEAFLMRQVKAMYSHDKLQAATTPKEVEDWLREERPKQIRATLRGAAAAREREIARGCANQLASAAPWHH